MASNNPDTAPKPPTPLYRHGDVFHTRAQELEREEFMRGQAAGRLAVALDVLTDALILVGQHGIYCASERNPALPKLDLQAVLAGIGGAKDLVVSAILKLNEESEARRRNT